MRLRRRIHVRSQHSAGSVTGMRDEKLMFRYSGHDFRLTDVAGNVVKDIIT